MENPVDPITVPDWNRTIARLPGATIFHTAEWAQVLKTAYGYTPEYFIAGDKQNISDCIPIMGIHSWITGRRGVSLPFTDECHPLCSHSVAFRELWEQAVRHALQRRWKHIELRGHLPAEARAPALSSYYVHTLSLEDSEHNIAGRLRSSTRRNIEKAIKNNVQVRCSRHFSALKQFSDLNMITRRDHGLPPQPIAFFKALHCHMINQSHGFIMLAFHNDEAIAGAVFLHFNGQLLYKYGASLKRYQNLRANNLIMWEAIRWGLAHRCKQLNFGRTEPVNSGLRQFKNGWGTEEKTLNYYSYDPRRTQFRVGPSNLKSSYAVFRKFPTHLLVLSGRLLYRHIG